MIRTAIGLTILSSVLLGQGPAPRFMYVYRDSLRSGVDSAYRAIENDGAQICVDLRCPNPYIALESLGGIHEAWWINMFASAADTARVAKVYATDSALARALGDVAKRKAALIGTPVQGFAVYRADLSPGPRMVDRGGTLHCRHGHARPSSHRGIGMDNAGFYAVHSRNFSNARGGGGSSKNHWWPRVRPAAQLEHASC
jgi:hypothetical protein